MALELAGHMEFARVTAEARELRQDLGNDGQGILQRCAAHEGPFQYAFSPPGAPHVTEQSIGPPPGACVQDNG